MTFTELHRVDEACKHAEYLISVTVIFTLLLNDLSLTYAYTYVRSHLAMANAIK